jgi:hypothetical protein
MAQAKTRAPSKRAAGSKKSQARSRGSSKKTASSRKRATPRKQSNGSKPTPVAAVSKATDKATTAVGDTATKATSAVGTAAGKAKVPLLAGGAALAGIAGGAALGARQARRHPNGFSKAAKGVGALGIQAGHLASDLQRNREAKNGQHRSPLEVVLEGLTARRSRS